MADTRSLEEKKREIFEKMFLLESIRRQATALHQGLREADYRDPSILSMSSSKALEIEMEKERKLAAIYQREVLEKKSKKLDYKDELVMKAERLRLHKHSDSDLAIINYRNQVVRQQDLALLNRLPSVVVIYYLLPFLKLERDVKTAHVLSQVNRDSAAAFQKFFQIIPGTMIKRLNEHILRGEEVEAEQIIAKNPLLLLKETTVSDPSGRLITATPYRAALGAGDKAMWKMIEPYFDKIPNGSRIMLEQRRQQFPHGLFVMVPFDFAPYLNGIKKAKNAEECNRVIDQFRLSFKLRYTKELIKMGMHFCIEDFIRALKLYLSHFKKLDDDNSYKSEAFWIGIIGTIQNSLPAWLAQQFYCQLPFSRYSHRSWEMSELLRKFENNRCRSLLICQSRCDVSSFGLFRRWHEYIPFYSSAPGSGLGYDYALTFNHNEPVLIKDARHSCFFYYEEHLKSLEKARKQLALDWNAIIPPPVRSCDSSPCIVM